MVNAAGAVFVVVVVVTVVAARSVMQCVRGQSRGYGKLLLSAAPQNVIPLWVHGLIDESQGGAVVGNRDSGGFGRASFGRCTGGGNRGVGRIEGLSKTRWQRGKGERRRREKKEETRCCW